MAPHSSILVWRISWREEPTGLQSMGSERVRHHWSTKRTHTHTYLMSMSTFVYVNIQNFICECNIYSFISLPLLIAMRQSCFQNELLFDLNDVLTNHFCTGTKLAKIENLEQREREKENFLMGRWGEMGTHRQWINFHWESFFSFNRTKILKQILGRCDAEV